jgi:hypothetical protein
MRRRSTKFIKFPREWDEQLAHIQADGGTYRVAMTLLEEAYWTGGWVKLSNKLLESRGVSRWSKYRALEQLGRRGLISTTRAAGRSVVVKVKFTD